MRLEPLYRIRFTSFLSWMIGLDGGWEQHLFLAEGRCDGAIGGCSAARTPASGPPGHRQIVGP